MLLINNGKYLYFLDETTLQDSDDSDEDDYNQNINVCLSELEPISLDDNAKSSLASVIIRFF